MLKYQVFPLSLLLAGVSVYAADSAPDCGYLGISITNMSGETCILKHADGGSEWATGGVPTKIENGETSAIFFLRQTVFQGPTLEIDYRCGQNSVAKFVSGQHLCAFTAGDIYGIIYEGNDRSLEYKAIPGSYWNKLPGKIEWTIR